MTNLMFQTVDFEVCAAFRAAIEHDEPICASCGHLADDHGGDDVRDEVTRATVTRLRRPARPRRPVRKAS